MHIDRLLVLSQRPQLPDLRVLVDKDFAELGDGEAPDGRSSLERLHGADSAPGLIEIGARPAMGHLQGNLRVLTEGDSVQLSILLAAPCAHTAFALNPQPQRPGHRGWAESQTQT